jgi:uncharacterized membrane protein YdbT with pleckstrin-like domain
MSDEEFTAKIAARMGNQIMSDEKVLMGGRRHWLSYGRAIGFAVLALICLVLALMLPDTREQLGTRGSGQILLFFGASFMGVLALLQGLYTAILNWTLVMAVTTRRVFMRTGLIARDIVDIPLAKVDIVNLEQGVIDRIFGCGDVLVRTMGEVTTTFPAIDNPTAMRNAIVQAMESAAMRLAGAAQSGGQNGKSGLSG